MKIYTRTGDSGETSLFSGERVRKDDLRVEAYGTLDELNSVLGVASNFCRSSKVRDVLNSLQNQLFAAGADLATTSARPRRLQRLDREDWAGLEQLIDELEADLPPLKNFILPGGAPGASLLHLARTVCRRAERLVVRLQREGQEVNPDLLIYINRLSDLLFVLARFENVTQGGHEVVWKKRVR